MKFSLRQILASTAGAVIAALVASTFGVKGTIVGVAIGSAAATMGTAFVAQSIERGHEAVKQVAVRAPDTSMLLRKLGGTATSGPSTSSVDASSARTEVVGAPQPQSGGEEMAPLAETEALEISAATDAPATERLRASTSPVPPAVARPATARRFSWQAVAASAVVVFVLALLLITAIELISGKPLAAIFGGADSGTTLKNLVNPSPTPSTTPTSTSTASTTSTTAGATTTTTTTAGTTTTTSTTAPTGGVTTTTSPSVSTTTTAGAQATTTTTAVSSSP